MTLQDLFDLCDNLGYGTRIIVRNDRMKYIDEGSYPEMHALYGSKEIIAFKIDDYRHATVYLGGLIK